MDEKKGYDISEMDYPTKCPKCGASCLDIQGKNVSPIPYMCGSSLYPNGELSRHSNCYEKQLVVIEQKAKLIIHNVNEILYEGENLKYGCREIDHICNEIINSIA